jgi:hypothetical protein
VGPALRRPAGGTGTRPEGRATAPRWPRPRPGPRPVRPGPHRRRPAASARRGHPAATRAHPPRIGRRSRATPTQTSIRPPLPGRHADPCQQRRTVTVHTQRHPGGQDAARRPLPSPRPLPPFTSALNIRSVAIRSRNRGTSGRGSLRYLTSRLAAGSSSSFIRCSAALAVDSAAKPSGWTGSISNSSAACLAWWYVSAAACAASRYSSTKRHTMSLMDSWSLVVVILPPVGSYERVLPSRGMLAKPPRVKGSLADSGRQPEERLQTDVRALRDRGRRSSRRTTGG